MKMWARKTVESEFTKKELEILIDSSLRNKRNQEAESLLREKFGGEGYIYGGEIQDRAVEIFPEYKNVGGFEDIEWW